MSKTIDRWWVKTNTTDPEGRVTPPTAGERGSTTHGRGSISSGRELAPTTQQGRGVTPPTTGGRGSTSGRGSAGGRVSTSGGIADRPQWR